MTGRIGFFSIGFAAYAIAVILFSVSVPESSAASFGGLLGTDFSKRVSALQNQRQNLSDNYKNTSDQEAKALIAAKLSMTDRQLGAAESWSNVNTRVQSLIKNDPRRNSLSKLLKDAETPRDAFINADVTKKDEAGTKFPLISYDTYKPVSSFNKLEKDAVKAINAVNQGLLAPKKPGNVPSGDLMDDFIPGVIRILMRFASLAILISFIVSGVMLIAAGGDDESITKAKRILYYSLIGFVFISLAFAIVKAVSDIDFFGFV